MGRVVAPTITRPIKIPKDYMIKSANILDGTLSLSGENGTVTTIKISNLIDNKEMHWESPEIEHKKIEKLFTMPSELFSAIDFTTTGLINEPAHTLPSFIVGENYALKGVSCDGFEMKEKVYKLVGVIDSYGGVPVESVIVKQISGEVGNIYALSKNDCDKLGIEFQQGLQLFPKSLNWVRVIEDVEFDPHNLATTPKSIIDNTVRYILLKLNGFKDYLDGYVITPSGKLIKEEQFEQSIRVHAKEPVVYGNGFIRRDNTPLKINVVKPKTSIFNHGNFISSDDEVFILITLKNEVFNGRESFDGYFGVDPVYLDGINPNDYFIVMWDELGAKTVEEYKEEKARAEREHAEAVRKEEERIKREANKKKRETEAAIRRMNMFKVNTPRFDSDIHALESLDFYIKSLDGVFRDLDRRFSKVDYGNLGSRNFIKIPDNNGMICKIPLDYLI